MAKRNLAAVVDEGVPETKTVRVLEQHSYTKEVPIIEEATAAIIEEDTQPDIFSTFNEIVSTNESALLRIWLLPKYDIDGRASIHATDREYCGSIPYNSDNAVLLDQIQGRVPMGGMVQLELFANGAIRKRGLLKLIKQAVPISNNYNPPGTHLVINQPPAPAGAPATAPMTMVEQAESFLKVADVIKRLQPEQVQSVQRETVDDPSRPIGERILETLTLKALESDKVPIDRLLDAIGGGRKEPSMWEGVMEVIKAFAPTIDKVVSQMMATQAAQQRAILASQGVQTPAPAQSVGQLGEGAETASNEQGEASQPVDPISRDWFQLIIRMLEDCTRHVELASVGGGGKSVVPTAESVIELMERYPAELGPTIAQLLTVEPMQVIDLCSMMMVEQPQVQAHIERVLKPSTAAVEWITSLQEECKRIIEDAKQEEDDNEDKKAS